MRKVLVLLALLAACKRGGQQQGPPQGEGVPVTVAQVVETMNKIVKAENEKPSRTKANRSGSLACSKRFGGGSCTV